MLLPQLDGDLSILRYSAKGKEFEDLVAEHVLDLHGALVVFGCVPDVDCDSDHGAFSFAPRSVAGVFHIHGAERNPEAFGHNPPYSGKDDQGLCRLVAPHI